MLNKNTINIIKNVSSQDRYYELLNNFKMSGSELKYEAIELLENSYPHYNENNSVNLTLLNISEMQKDGVTIEEIEYDTNGY